MNKKNHKRKHEKRVFRSRTKSFGQPPGALIHIGERKVEKTQITAIGYREGESVTIAVKDAAECLALKSRFRVLWINVDGLHETGVIETFGNLFGIDSLTQEDILHTGQRPKIEDFERYLYMTLQMLDFNREHGEIEREQLSIILGADYVISFQEKPGDTFDPVRQRIRSAVSKIGKHGADFLAYALVDAVVDHYFSVLEEIENRIDSLDAEMLADFNPETFNALNALKRELVIFRKTVWPLREIIGSVTRADFEVVGDAVEPYFRDVYDHIIEVIDTVEVFREIVTGMHENWLAGVNNRMNEIMKFLTMIATIFMPLSFIAGVYGMNFRNMPELNLWWGYYAVLGVMLLIVFGFLKYYRSRRWY
ncbi:magnesium/cobalt transporter CorA [Chlorobaculum sp. 24CR]|uniref:magnesium/cobalt transporter CorA n=1 Tax=Chlorobaculum sp. 24CR TaxID=2508878 RepID=UPI00100B00FB|nr:magnesium/cobalt transporter CorA [Chlorobaculum sp. 24CR]RXK88790.1 magnesium/cobalt transporter CorA [Chlorobaculum sp. 24CR]